MNSIKLWLTKYFKFLVLGALLYQPLFGHMDTLCLWIWDEARPANNAYEMLKSGWSLVTTFLWEPDLYSTKPPLLVWIQVLFMKVLGVNEIAIRLPSAIAAFFTCVLMLVFSKRYFNSIWLGIIAVLVLVTSKGYIGLHVARTGDYDTLLTLFMTGSALLFFGLTRQIKSKWVYGFAALQILAIWTKGVAGLLFLPSFVLYVLYKQKIKAFLTNKHIYLGALAVIVLGLGYYPLREWVDAGYIQAIWNNELGGRYTTVIEGHKHPFSHYFTQLYYYQWAYWIVMLPVALCFGLFSTDKRYKEFTIYSLFITIGYLLIISNADTKVFWYNAPLFPFLAFQIAIMGITVFNHLKTINVKQYFSYNFLPYAFLFLFFFKPYTDIFYDTYKPKEFKWSKQGKEIAYFLREGAKGWNELDGNYILHESYDALPRFYVRYLREKNIHLRFRSPRALEEGDVAILSQPSVRKQVDSLYQYEALRIRSNVLQFKVLCRKDQEPLLPSKIL